MTRPGELDTKYGKTSRNDDDGRPGCKKHQYPDQDHRHADGEYDDTSDQLVCELQGMFDHKLSPGETELRVQGCMIR